MFFKRLQPWLAIFLLLLAAQAQGQAGSSAKLPAALTQLSQLIDNQPAVNLSFQQQQKLPLLNQPLESEGDIIVVSKRGLVWSVKTPFPETQVISTDKDQNDLGNAASNDGFALVSKLLLALFSADLDSLGQYFDHQLQQSLGHGAWQLELTPQESWLAEHILGIQLQGSDRLKQVTIRYPDDIISTLNILEVSALDAAPASLISQ